MASYEDFTDQRIKHLELIQAVISRLGTDSFLVKGWSATLVAAFVGFAIDKDEWGLAIAGVVPAILFWMLDAYFLRAERLFRELFDAVRTSAVEAFFMGATSAEFAKEAGGQTSWPRVLFSRTLLLFYGSLLVTALVVAAIVCR